MSRADSAIPRTWSLKAFGQARPVRAGSHSHEEAGDGDFEGYRPIESDAVDPPLNAGSALTFAFLGGRPIIRVID
jgi:hypothetical protein